MRMAVAVFAAVLWFLPPPDGLTLPAWRLFAVFASALGLMAVAASPVGAGVGGSFGVPISFGSWLLASSLPTLAGIALMPPFLSWLIAPEKTATPDAPAAARRALDALGLLSGHEK